MPKIPFKLILKIFKNGLLLLVLMVAGMAATFYFNRDFLMELRQKDEVRFDVIVEEVRQFHPLSAWNLFVELKELSHQKSFDDRYKRYKQRWEEDPEFRQQILKERIPERKEARKRRRLGYEQEIEDILESSQISVRSPKEQWSRADAWHRGLILREKCLQFIEMEIRDFENRRRLSEAPKRGAFLTRPRITDLTPAEYCQNLVPVSHKDDKVDEALHNLKQGMNYYYFVRLLDDIGLRDSELFPYPTRLERMTDDLNDI
jgi:hypothetical protein